MEGSDSVKTHIVESADGETEYEMLHEECHPDGEVCCDECLQHNGFDIPCPGCKGEDGQYDDMCLACQSEVDGLADDRYVIAKGEL